MAKKKTMESNHRVASVLATGLAHYPGVDGTDEASGNFVDRYFGVHLIGGDHQSGEGPYISYDRETGYYYLYCTYGGLTAEGGYNMRLFRSENVTGPYLDAAGNLAADNRKSGDRYGIKLIGNYAFYDQTGMRAAGHNSQLNASDGSRYLVYHQRFDVKPQLEAHEVRVHQQFLNEDLWPVTAVYEYCGEEPSHYEEAEVAGTYEYICHGSRTSGDMLETQVITLEEDGTIRGAEEVTVWRKHDTGIMSIHIWAPELHYLRGQWYLYYAAGDKDDIWAIRPYVLRCTGQDPLRDAWVEEGMLKRADDFCFNDFSLDMTVFEHKDRLYAIWAEKVNQGKKISSLYIAELETPTVMKSAQVLLSTPDYDWERVDFWVNEGASVMKAAGRLFVTYSASATGACYCMGMLSIPEDANLLDPRAWTKERYPVLETDAACGLYGPGHNTFFTDEHGKLVTSYHARPYDEIIGDPLYDINRHTYLMDVDIRDGKPVFCYENNRM